MNPDKQSKLLSTLIIILLLSQVLLSVALILKLDRLDQRVLAGLNNQIAQNDSPSFIGDVSIDDDPRLGTSGAIITIIEFSDYECPFCADATGSIDRILSEYEGKILFVYRDFPLEHIHPNAFQAAETAHCAGDQNKYWEMHSLLFANQTQLDIDSLKKYASELGLNLSQFDKCLDSHKYQEEIRRDIADGLKYQVNGTPTFFINGYRVVGGSYEQLKSTIDLLLNK